MDLKMKWHCEYRTPCRLHDISLVSAGVLADPVNGGLKRDLSVAFELSDAQFAMTEFGGGATGAAGTVSAQCAILPRALGRFQRRRQARPDRRGLERRPGQAVVAERGRRAGGPQSECRPHWYAVTAVWLGVCTRARE